MSTLCKTKLPQETIDIGTKNRQIKSSHCRENNYTYSVLVTGVPVRHQRYCESSFATHTLRRVDLRQPKMRTVTNQNDRLCYLFRMLCASSITTRNHCTLARGPLLWQRMFKMIVWNGGKDLQIFSVYHRYISIRGIVVVGVFLWFLLLLGEVSNNRLVWCNYDLTIELSQNESSERNLRLTSYSSISFTDLSLSFPWWICTRKMPALVLSSNSSYH